MLKTERLECQIIQNSIVYFRIGHFFTIDIIYDYMPAFCPMFTYAGLMSWERTLKKLNIVFTDLSGKGTG